MAKNLVIVESPAKAKTIKGFLGNDFEVKSSFGHIRDLSKSQLGVDIANRFIPAYEVAADKKKVIAELKAGAAKAELVWLASDEDREGEAISWHLAEVLDLPQDKIRRIVFHEITKEAIRKAVENPRTIDMNLVNAQQARRVLDRLVGYELSPLLWKKVKPALSAGRVQSVAVRLIVEREDEIRNFKIESYFKVSAVFEITREDGMRTLDAELLKRFQQEQQAREFLEACDGAVFKVASVDKKPSRKSPAPPFTTSTLQQEASRKLGFSVSKTMLVAQQLYESGKITYMRTDSVHLSELALGTAKKVIKDLFGSEYIKTRQFTTKTKGAQEAHEAIRPTYLDQQNIEGDASQKKLYDLIWKRTVASQMSDAEIEKTEILIDISASSEQFVARGEVILFDGFLKVYLESRDEEEDKDADTEGMLPAVKNGEPLYPKKIEAAERFSKNPPRYAEASLVKKLEELGIGRPSTYAPIISTVQKRGYVVREDRHGTTRHYKVFTLQHGKIKETSKKEQTGFEKGKLFPTDIGILVNRFLEQYFSGIIDYQFTANVEKEFDEVATGTKEWNDVIAEFYQPFHSQVEETQEKTSKYSGEKLLGTDPKTGKNVYVKIGRFGPMVQIGETSTEDKPLFAGLKKGQSMESIVLEEALDLFKFPKIIGTFEDADLVIGIGRFGPFVRHNSKFYSLGKLFDPSTITVDEAISVILGQRDKIQKNLIQEFSENPDIRVLNGKFGPYISSGRGNYKIPKDKDPASLSLQDCLAIIESAPEPKKQRSFAGRKKSAQRK